METHLTIFDTGTSLRTSHAARHGVDAQELAIEQKEKSSRRGPRTVKFMVAAEEIHTELTALRSRLQQLQQCRALLANCHYRQQSAIAQSFAAKMSRPPQFGVSCSVARRPLCFRDLLVGLGVRSWWDTALAWNGIVLLVALLVAALLVVGDQLGTVLHRHLPNAQLRRGGPKCPLTARPPDWNTTGAAFCVQNEVMGYWAGLGCTQCARGWRGLRCRQPCSDLWHCSGHGRCAEGGHCECHRDWEGEACGDLVEDHSRRDYVREAYLRSWAAYKRDAFGHDVLLPVTRTHQDWIPGGMGLTLIDALDGLWMLGEFEEFRKAKDWVKTRISFDVDCLVSVFETTIRVLGGLLSAYTFDKDWGLIEKAVDLADRLLPSFRSPTGVPYTHVNLRTGAVQNNAWAPNSSILAELGSLQLEFRYLSHLTGNAAYDWHATQVMHTMERQMPADGLFPLYYNNELGTWASDHVSFGALGDSFYEYLLKQWLLTGKQEARYQRMYNATVMGLMTQLVVRTRRHTYIAERQGKLHHKMDHLACFSPGMLALGANSDPEVMEVAEALAQTCVQMYFQTATGIGPESTLFDKDVGTMRPSAKYYILRPEVIESLFYLWRLTKKEIYRKWGWRIFQSIERHCRLDTGGYSGIRDVTKVPSMKNDNMSSFWLAETLKYLYLLFAEDQVLSLDQYVFNTEGHPFPRIPPRPLF